MSGAIHLDRHGQHVALIRIDRPEARNALTPRMLCALADAFLAVRDDAEVRAVVLTGTGDVAFCAGGDLGLTLPLMTGALAPQDEFDRRLLDDPRTLEASSLRGFDIAVALRTDVSTLYQVWLGQLGLAAAQRARRLVATGHRAFVRDLSLVLQLSPMAAVGQAAPPGQKP